MILYGLFNVLEHGIFMLQFFWFQNEELKPESPPTYPESKLAPGHPHYKDSSNEPKVIINNQKITFFKTKTIYLFWLLFPLIPIFMAILWPQSIPFTNNIKPISQIASHIPQLKECLRLRTTLGISILTQHLNFIGGVLGIWMCIIIPPVHLTTYIIYSNSIFQALSIYVLVFYFGDPMFPSFRKEVVPSQII